MIDCRVLAEAGVHFGHESSRWNPKMAECIWGTKNKVHIIHLLKTAQKLEKAAQFLESIAQEGKTILWVGTKKAAQESIRANASRLGCPYVDYRWIGGTLTNYSQFKKMRTRLLHFEDVIANAAKFPLYTKKDFGSFQKIIDRLQKNVGGMRSFTLPIGAIVIVDVCKEASALKEAVQLGIPVVALVDTNGDPSRVSYLIPANDDTPRSVSVILNYLGDAVARGKAEAVEKAASEASAEETSLTDDATQAELLRLAAEEEGAAEEAGRKKRGKSGAGSSSGRQRSDTGDASGAGSSRSSHDRSSSRPSAPRSSKFHK